MKQASQAKQASDQTNKQTNEQEGEKARKQAGTQAHASDTRTHVDRSTAASIVFLSPKRGAGTYAFYIPLEQMNLQGLLMFILLSPQGVHTPKKCQVETPGNNWYPPTNEHGT